MGEGDEMALLVSFSVMINLLGIIHVLHHLQLSIDALYHGTILQVHQLGK